MTPIHSAEYLELKSMLSDVLCLLERYVQDNTLEWTPLIALAEEWGRDPKTLRNYVRNNFEPRIEFKKEGRKIYVHKAVLPALRSRYGKTLH